MTLSETLIQGAIAALIAGVPTAIGARFAYRQATKVQQHADRAALTDDLQEEVAALRSAVGEARRETDQLRHRLRGAMEYLDLCMNAMRQNGIEPPSVPAIVRYPWEGDFQ